MRRDPRGRPRSPRRNWCEAGAASRSGRAPPGGFARRGGECAEPGLCMKPLDPSQQRQRRRSPAERSRRRAALVSSLGFPGSGGAGGPVCRDGEAVISVLFMLQTSALDPSGVGMADRVRPLASLHPCCEPPLQGGGVRWSPRRGQRSAGPGGEPDRPPCQRPAVYEPVPPSTGEPSASLVCPPLTHPVDSFAYWHEL